MRHLRHHAANRGVVGALDDLVQPGKTQAPDDSLMFHGSANRRSHPLQPNLAALSCCFRRHQSSSTAFPRMVAIASRFFSFFSASKVALITLCGLVVPMDLVSTFCTPTEVITARTAPPAITPVPSGAGFSSTMPDPNVPSTACGIEVL